MLRSFPLLLLLPAVAFAQTAEVVAKLDAKLDAERAAQRTEDVEILRRLLNKACGLPDKVSVRNELSLNPGGGGVGNLEEGNFVGDAKSHLVTSAPVGPFDGVYLPNAGVVFTLHVPAGAPRTQHADRIGLNSACSVCHTPGVTVPASSLVPHTSPSPVLSEWDRVKQDVRGDKAKPADKPKEDKPKAAVCEPGDLQAVVAGVLAANAKNVRHLPEKEGVMVVVTFDEVKPATSYTYRTYFDPVVKGEDGKPVLKTVVEPTATEAGDVFALTNKPFTPDEVKGLNLGDLHLKQGKHKEAAAAYGEALNRFWAKPFKVSAPAAMTPEQKGQFAEELQKGVRDAMKNYAKALLLADQPDRAKEALDMATGFVVLEVSPINPPAANTAPAKLLVGVSKADVDAAKDAAAVRKAVKAERVNFPTARAK